MKLGKPRDDALKPLLCISLPSTHFIPPRLTLIVKVGVKTWLRPIPMFQRLLGFRCPGPAGSLGAEESRFFVLVLGFLRVPSIEPRSVAEVVVDSTAVLVGIVCLQGR